KHMVVDRPQSLLRKHLARGRNQAGNLKIRATEKDDTFTGCGKDRFSFRYGVPDRLFCVKLRWCWVSFCLWRPSFRPFRDTSPPDLTELPAVFASCAGCMRWRQVGRASRRAGGLAV